MKQEQVIHQAYLGQYVTDKVKTFLGGFVDVITA